MRKERKKHEVLLHIRLNTAKSAPTNDILVFITDEDACMRGHHFWGNIENIVFDFFKMYVTYLTYVHFWQPYNFLFFRCGICLMSSSHESNDIRITDK